jgi:hypothetical protein
MSNCHRGPSIDASDQVSAHLAKWFQKGLFRYRPMRNNNYMWRPCLLTDRDEMNTLYRRSSIDTSYLVSIADVKKSISQKYIGVAVMYIS